MAEVLTSLSTYLSTTVLIQATCNYYSEEGKNSNTTLYFTCWERADLLAFVGDAYFIFVIFPCGILGQVWYLTVLFPDLCHLSYFVFPI